MRSQRAAAIADDRQHTAAWQLLIAGRLVAQVAGARVYASVNPATGDVLGYAPDAGVDKARAAIAAARRAFDTTSWPTDVERRIRCLDQLHQALIAHRDELAALTIAEVGATAALTAGAQLDQPIAIVPTTRTCSGPTR